MIGTTLVEIRERVEALASDDGEYYVVCGRTGDRPVPAAGKWFDDRATARRAARATEQYRAALRRYDPHVPCYDLVVCQDTGPVTHAECPDRSREPSSRALSAPVLDGASPDLGQEQGQEQERGRRQLVEFSHRVAAAVFETLSGEHGAVESAIMDAYFDLAEALADPDDLCLCLLESAARELDRQLTPAEQADVLAGAATRLPAPESADRPVQPVPAALGLLEERGLLGGYTRSQWSVDPDGARSVALRLSEYALSPRDGRLPVLPLVLELHRHQLDRPPSSLRAVDVDVDGGWRLTLVLASEPGETGLASAPIHTEV